MINVTLDFTHVAPAVPIAVAVAIVLPWVLRIVRPLVRSWMEQQTEEFEEVVH